MTEQEPRLDIRLPPFTIPDPPIDHRAVACVKACAGVADPAELRRQRDALLAFAQECATLNVIYTSRECRNKALDLVAHVKASMQ